MPKFVIHIEFEHEAVEDEYITIRDFDTIELAREYAREYLEENDCVIDNDNIIIRSVDDWILHHQNIWKSTRISG